MPAKLGLTQVEKDKLEISPDFDFREIAERPFEELTPNEIGMFKWWGVYHQLQSTFFMIRLVTPGGLMTSVQLRRAAELAEAYGQGELCITTRQTLQFHWIRQQDIFRILEGMADVGVTTKNGCGDVTRNIVSCSLQDVCPHEVGDWPRRFVEALANDHEIRDLQRNLPRKHKISVASCDRACAQTLMNCQGWVPILRQASGGDAVPGWQFHAGGGLGARPYLAKRIFDWVPDALALPVAKATVEAFRRHGNRRKRAHARLKVVVDQMGPRAFGEVLLGILRERSVSGIDEIEFATDPTPQIGPSFLNGQETIGQKQDGLNTVRVMVPRSELKTEQSLALAEWAESYGSGEIMFTNRQNVEIRNVPTAKVPELLAHIHASGLRTAGHDRLPDVVACVGTTVCRLAVGDSPAVYRQLVDAFADDRSFWETVGELRVNVTGCPNNCAHAWIGDIGLRGKRIRSDTGGSVEGFDIFVGGKLSDAGRIGEWLGDVPADEVVPALRRVLDYYVQRRHDGERFIDFCERTPVADIQSALIDG